jgi:serine/threonine protein kinase
MKDLRTPDGTVLSAFECRHSGGLPTVHLARVLEAAAPTMPAAVVLELFGCAGGDAGFIESQLQEVVWVAARLPAPAFIGVYEGGLLRDGLPHGAEGPAIYVLLEIAYGLSLSRLLERRRNGAALSTPQSLALGIAIAENLAVLHDQRDANSAPLGASYREFGPGRVVLTADGQVRLLPPLPCRWDRSGDEPSNDVVAYAPPESMGGEAPSPLSDLYVLGVILWELLLGGHPFRRATTRQTVRAVMSEPPLAPATALSQLPPHVGRVLSAVLEKDPTNRPRSAAGVARELEQAAARLGPTAALATLLDEPSRDNLVCLHAAQTDSSVH